jgi:hypothetical protein
MSFIEIKSLLLAQIGIDVAIVIFFIFLIRRLKYHKKGGPLGKGAQVFESLLTEANMIAGQFKDQLEEKHRLMRRLNEQLDNRIISLNMLLNRADLLLSANGTEAKDAHNTPTALRSQQTEIIALSEKGHQLEQIADMLSIPKGEVKLVLDLKKRLSQIGHKSGVS